MCHVQLFFFYQWMAINNYIQLRSCGGKETWAYHVYWVVAFPKKNKNQQKLSNNGIFCQEVNIFNQTYPRDSHCELQLCQIFSLIEYIEGITVMSANQWTCKKTIKAPTGICTTSPMRIKPSVGWAVAMFIHVSANSPTISDNRTFSSVSLSWNRSAAPAVLHPLMRYRATPVTVQSGDYLGFI